jgi:hypothetical protein
MCYACYLFLFVYSGIQHILVCCCFVFPRLVYSMLAVSLDCPFLIGLSVFYNVHLQTHILLTSPKIFLN